ncbi:MAG: hypothetical protein KKC46_02650 [Proteobacteria bacterium]|nr:hypothetical protein [Pseudomonadota bacterium]
MILNPQTPGRNYRSSFKKCYTYGKGSEGVKVLFYRIEEGGHAWPGRLNPYLAKTN